MLEEPRDRTEPVHANVRFPQCDSVYLVGSRVGDVDPGLCSIVPEHTHRLAPAGEANILTLSINTEHLLLRIFNHYYICKTNKTSTVRRSHDITTATHTDRVIIIYHMHSLVC